MNKQIGHGFVVGVMVTAGLLGAAHGLGGSTAPDFSGTAKQRKGLYEALVRDTLAWEAFSPRKNAALELDFAADAEEFRREFLKADSERELYAVLMRFSNLRCNGSLRVHLHDDGLRVELDHQELPVRFALDESSDEPRLFIVDHDVDVQRKLNTISPKSARVEAGDVVVEVNGAPVAEVVEQLRPYLSFSTTRQLWHEAARVLSLKRHDLPHGLFKKDIHFDVHKANGKKYRLRVSFIDWTDTLDWAIQWKRHRYVGFERALQTASFDVYIPSAGGPLGSLIIEGRRFGPDTDEDVTRLRDWALEQGALHFDVVLDLSDAQGSDVPWSLLEMLIAEPVLPTLARLRLSDLTPAWVARTSPTASPALRSWLQDVVRPAAESVSAEGEPVFAEPVPQDLVVAPDSDGVLDPAEVHFQGQRALVIDHTSSQAANHLAAIWIDNGVGPSYGTAPGGNANAWQWRVPIHLPREDRPLVEFEWNLGHVLRPNGEILEGNPPQPSNPMPVSPENFQGWHFEQIALALRGFEKE